MRHQKNNTLSYSKVPGRRMGLIIFEWLMSGNDHLLLVQQVGYMHLYRRFYFKDIQGIILQRTKRQTTFNIIIVSFLLLTLLTALLGGITYLVGILLLVYTALLIINVAEGPYCSCWMQTRISCRRMPISSRERRAAKVCEMIHRQIVAAQGQLDIERYEDALQQPDTRLVASPSTRIAEQEPPVRTAAGGRLMSILSVVCLGCALFSLPSVISALLVFSAAAVLLHVAAIGLSVSALTYFASRHASTGMKVAAWMISAYLAVFLLIAFAMRLVLNYQSQLISWAADIPQARMAMTVHSLLMAVLAVNGLLQVYKHRQRVDLHTSPLPPPLPHPAGATANNHTLRTINETLSDHD